MTGAVMLVLRHKFKGCAKAIEVDLGGHLFREVHGGRGSVRPSTPKTLPQEAATNLPFRKQITNVDRLAHLCYNSFGLIGIGFMLRLPAKAA